MLIDIGEPSLSWEAPLPGQVVSSCARKLANQELLSKQEIEPKKKHSAMVSVSSSCFLPHFDFSQ